jgi:hypothetical protein
VHSVTSASHLAATKAALAPLPPSVTIGGASTRVRLRGVDSVCRGHTGNRGTLR